MDNTHVTNTAGSFSNPLLAGFDRLRLLANAIGAWVGMLGIRLFLAYEYGDSGLMKHNAENWFPEIEQNFPFPFNVLPSDFSWFLATWSEMLGAVALALGLATRFFSISLIILTVVAWVSVHGPYGFNVCDGGYKLTFIYLLMYIPLVLNGPGKLSLDYLLLKRSGNRI